MVNQYNSVKLNLECQSKLEAVSVIRKGNKVVCSSLSRSIESENI